MKWTTDHEFSLVLLALADAPSFTVNAERIRQAWPKGGEVPTIRAITDRFSAIKKRIPGVKLAVSGNTSAAKQDKTRVPIQSISTPVKGFDSVAPVTPTSTSSTIPTPSANPSVQKPLTQKRKRSIPSDNDSSETSLTDNSMSDDESTLKKACRSPSLRRSTSVRLTYRFEDESGEEKDAAAMEIDTEEEWGQREGDRKHQKGKKDTQQQLLGGERDDDDAMQRS